MAMSDHAFQPWAKSSMVSNATAAKGEVLPYRNMATCHGKSWEATASGEKVLSLRRALFDRTFLGK